jgi:hypothetical protein
MRLFLFLLSFACIFAAIPTIPVFAAQQPSEYDNTRSKVDLNCWISAPTGYFNGKSGEGYFDLSRDFGFGNYATFNGKWDWRFKRKHHLIFAFTPALSSRTTTITRAVAWQGQTFNLGSKVQSDIESLIFTPAYQWDFLRRESFWLGLLVNVNLAYTDAKLKAVASVSSGSGATTTSRQADGSLFAPLPSIGPHFRWYPVPRSVRLYLDGTLTGMSFFGYGNFVSGNAVIGFPVARQFDVRVGYLLGSRFKIYGSSDNIGVRLTQKGPVFGIEYHWDAR